MDDGCTPSLLTLLDESEDEVESHFSHLPNHEDLGEGELSQLLLLDDQMPATMPNVRNSSEDAYIKLACGLDRYCPKILQASEFIVETFDCVAEASDKAFCESICYWWIDSDGVLKVLSERYLVSLAFDTQVTSHLYFHITIVSYYSKGEF